MKFGFMNVILLCSDHWHVSAIKVAIFRVLSVNSGTCTVQIIPSLNNLEYNIPYTLPMYTTPQNQYNTPYTLPMYTTPQNHTTDNQFQLLIFYNRHCFSI
jgi:hypothetical protein